MNELTYLCELELLDHTEAHFKAGDSGVYLTMRRDNWHDLDRPSRLFITPTANDPYLQRRFQAEENR